MSLPQNAFTNGGIWGGLQNQSPSMNTQLQNVNNLAQQIHQNQQNIGYPQIYVTGSTSLASNQTALMCQIIQYTGSHPIYSIPPSKFQYFHGKLAYFGENSVYNILSYK